MSFYSRKIYSKAILTLGLSCVFINPLYAQMNALTDGEVFGEIRYRYEFVDQDGIQEDANANTIRTNLGFKTGEMSGFSGLIEGQLVQNIGADDFNSLDNGNTQFPVVADPDVAQVNRAWIQYKGLYDTVFKIGRQAINLDGQRFIGTVGWRQNDQTFDAATVTNTSIENAKIHYGYIDNVNRIFAGDTPPDDLNSQSHIINASYEFAEQLKATAYSYWLNFEDATALSNKTHGLSLTGKIAFNDSDWKLGYQAEYATQSDHADNTNNYDEDYYHLGTNITGHGYNFKIGYEVLGGDGNNAFQTPLATLHKYNGWADKFLTTPDAGLEDFYIGASYKISDTPSNIFNDTKIQAIYHDYSGDNSSDFGSEINLAFSKSFTLPGDTIDKIDVLLKYADYDAKDGPYTDTQKFWLQIGTKF